MIRSTESSSCVEFDIHGIVGVRLANASPSDIETVQRQLGPIQATLDRDPEITVSFVDRLELDSTINLFGTGEVGFTEDEFVVMRAKHKSPARVVFPFDSLGSPCEIICERGLKAVPLLIATINLIALSRGYLPMHASAFTHQGTGVLVTGWSKGGKTEALLGFMSEGAEYIGDEWVYIGPDGKSLYGIPEPMHVWDWHLADLPELRKRLTRKQSSRLRNYNFAARSVKSIFAKCVAPQRMRERIENLVNRQRFVQVAPHQFFQGQTGTLRGQMDQLFFVMSHESPETTIESIGATEVAQRMMHSLREERQVLMTMYRMFRFAFPNRKNELIESIEDIERKLVNKLFGDQPAYVVKHPYPASPVDMYRVMAPIVENRRVACSQSR